MHLDRRNLHEHTAFAKGAHTCLGHELFRGLTHLHLTMTPGDDDG